MAVSTMRDHHPIGHGKHLRRIARLAHPDKHCPRRSTGSLSFERHHNPSDELVVEGFNVSLGFYKLQQKMVDRLQLGEKLMYEEHAHDIL